MNAPPLDLMSVFISRYGEPAAAGPNPRRRYRFGYYSPDEHYEALVSQNVNATTSWLDVGGGKHVFPHNHNFAASVVGRAKKLTAVDPSPNVYENTIAHEHVQSMIEDYKTDEKFDLITMRMVAEHITQPSFVMNALYRLCKPGGKVMIYTVNKWSPVSMLATAIPHRFHHRIKKVFWGTEENDTFPVSYKMNTHSALRTLAKNHGFDVKLAQTLDDCRTFYAYRLLNYTELITWRACQRLGMNYPENCLLYILEKHPTPDADTMMPSDEKIAKLVDLNTI